ncbi:MAG: hypothetical protein IPK72_21230 [Candidatus Eisenbacteria bacterium]|nr:hypothetical protein [Candidatus Eisenbacteria bacterium]
MFTLEAKVTLLAARTVELESQLAYEAGFIVGQSATELEQLRAFRDELQAENTKRTLENRKLRAEVSALTLENELLRSDRDKWKQRAEIIDNAGELLAEKRIGELELALTQETEAHKLLLASLPYRVIDTEAGGFLVAACFDLDTANETLRAHTARLDVCPDEYCIKRVK